MAIDLRPGSGFIYRADAFFANKQGVARELDQRGRLEQRLLVALKRVLGSSMGVRFTRQSAGEHAIAMPANPVRSALLWLVVYAVLWGVVAFCTSPPAIGHDKLVSLLAWGALYFTAAIFLAQSATANITETIQRQIIPNASDDYLEAVARDLEHRYRPILLVGVPLLVALLSVPAAIFTLALDVKSGADLQSIGQLRSWELLLFAVSYFYYFYAAAVSVVAARFYSAFTEHLGKERSRLFVLGAADTPLVRGLARLGMQVLIFWVLIFLAIVSSTLLAVLPQGGYRLPADSKLLFTMVPISVFFSLGFGTLVYLASEAEIRATLQAFTAEQAGGLQRRINALLCPGDSRVPQDPKEVEQLTAWHDRILAGGRYGSRIGAVVSITLPFLMPLLSFVVNRFIGS